MRLPGGGCRGGGRTVRLAIGLGAAATLLAATAGCSRTYYRHFADRDIYAIERERLNDPRWAVPLRPIEPDARARFRDVHDPDAQPTPLDDAAAYPFQVSERLHSIHSFQKIVRERGVTPIEDPAWLDCLPRAETGEVILSRETAMQLAIMHGRDYQTRMEGLYLSALAVDLARFQFQVQPYYNQALDYQVAGSPANGSSQVIPVARAGFTKLFYSGANLSVDFVNNLLFEYDGDGFSTVGTALTTNFSQPLLRGAFARNVTQPLSLLERAMLYAVREFAHYRRSLYVETIAQGGYLGLLQQTQAIRNAEENLASLKRNLEETEALVRANFKSPSERDQVALSYQQAQVTLLSQEANLETTLDAYRVQLGLPPDLPMKIEDGPLRTFDLNDPDVETLRAGNDELYLSLLQTDQAPRREVLVDAARQLDAGVGRLEQYLARTRGELDRWRQAIGQLDADGIEGALLEPPPDATESQKFEHELAIRLDRTLDQAAVDLPKDRERIGRLIAAIEAASPGELGGPWQELRTLVGNDFRSRYSDIFVTQTLARVYLIQLERVPLSLDRAIAVALGNRQDLMNARARVADAWRNVEVAANQLQAGLSVNFQSVLATDPNFDGIFRFDASASLHRIGLRFDAPIVRRAERNAYRAAQIEYQRARRAYMLQQDEVVREIRLDLRNLNLAHRQFDIGREQLVTSARAVEENEINLRSSREPNAGLTLLLLTSLNNLLGAKNSLIGNWVQYETARLSLYRDLDIMNVDASGTWINEHDDPATFDAGEPGPLPGRYLPPPDLAARPYAPEPTLPPLPR